MALKIELKPGEKIILGESVITNSGGRAKLQIEGKTPILREPDIIRAEDAITPCQKIYFTLQLMYLGGDPSEHHENYFKLLKDVQVAAPSTYSFIERINNQILTGSIYKALKEAKALVAYEKELMEHAGSH